MNNPTRFVVAAVQVSSIAYASFEIARGTTEVMNKIINLIFTTRTIYAAVIECSIHVALEILCQTIEPLS